MSDDNIVNLPPHGKAPKRFEQSDSGRLECKWCGTPTLWGTLAQYGARCLDCYERYVRESHPWPAVGDKNIGPKAWAHALKEREQSGERLTGAQRDAWRGALKTEQPEVEQ